MARRESTKRDVHLFGWMDVNFFTLPSMKSFVGPVCSTAPLLQSLNRPTKFFNKGKKEKVKIQPIKIDAQLSS